MTKTVFLPGAGGRRSFWQPVADRLDLGEDALLLGWPGFGDEPPDRGIHALSDLTQFVLDRVDGGFNLVAQSMGGVVALQLALAAGERLRCLVLCGTSGGVDFGAIEREDWRHDYLRDLPEQSPRWFVDDRTDITNRLGEIDAPALLLWGADDRIVPPAAGRHLASLLPNARLVVIPGTGHDVAQTKPDEVAAEIGAFLIAALDATAELREQSPVSTQQSPSPESGAGTGKAQLAPRAGVAGAQPMPVLSPVEGRGGQWGVSPHQSLSKTRAEQRDSDAQPTSGA